MSHLSKLSPGFLLRGAPALRCTTRQLLVSIGTALRAEIVSTRTYLGDQRPAPSGGSEGIGYRTFVGSFGKGEVIDVGIEERASVIRRSRAAGRRASRARTELLITVSLGLIVGSSLAVVAPWQVAALVGWDVAAGLFLGRIRHELWDLDATETARVATSEDPSRATADAVLVTVSLVCIVGVGFTLIDAANSKGDEIAGLLGLAVLSLICSWLVVHTVFMLRYARLYYTGTDGGISFNEDDPPAYPDFAYLAFTIGMTFQVSDTNIEDKTIRRTALRHALISYLFGAVLVAMTVNVGASLLK
jgi:uncharacterized membrane protein